MKIHLFNPENDLALAAGCSNYTPPPHAAALHHAGSLLPLWWAEDGDAIVIPDDFCNIAPDVATKLGLKCDFLPARRIPSSSSTLPPDALPSPWGWSDDAVRQLSKAGVECGLPTPEVIATHRLLSHRRSSIAILRELSTALGVQFPLPMEVTDPQQVVELEKLTPGCFIKSPWSSSGRGVFCALTLPEAALYDRAAGIINRQGSVMVERGLEKILDFAALFNCNPSANRANTAVSFEGLSIFKTELRGMYNGNVVAPQALLRQMLGRYIDLSRLDSIISGLERVLSHLIPPTFSSHCGVDMMIYRENGEFRIHPCIELNLRMTMGVAAMNICRRLKLNSPHFLAWHHSSNGSSRAHLPQGELLLPPAEGFSLILSSDLL